ncbi:PDZ domain-containing protein [candidate division KSB1 bacterium]
MKKAALSLLCIVFAVSFAFAEDGTRLLHQPDINGGMIVFVYAGDLWTAPSAGGDARQLTTHIGTESSPKFSPDGKWVAFSGQYDGNTDVFIIPAEGGTPKRLTYHPGGDNVMGWSPDGRNVLFSSNRFNPNRRAQLFLIGTEGGIPEQLPIPEVSLASYSPDGKFIAYTPVSNAFNSWKRYRGGRTTPVWVINLSDWSHVEIPHENASDTYPVWIGDTVYFLSDRNREMAIYGYNTRTKELKQHEKKSNADIKYLSGDRSKLIFAREGYLYTFDPNSGRTSQIVVDVKSELLHLRPAYKDVSGEIRNFHISPTGKRAVFEAHGEILTVPAEKGDIRNITETPGVMERYPSWSPDGKSIAYFSDESGEYALHIEDQMGVEPSQKIALSDPTFFYNSYWSPDGKKLVFTDKRNNILCFDVAAKNVEKIDDMASSPSWSADSKWITYQKRLHNRFGVIWAYSFDQKRSFQITDGMSDASGPVFDMDGKYLFFRASTNSGMTKSGLDMSSNDHPVTYNIYITVLRKDLPSPFEPESDDETVKEEMEEEEEAERPEKKEPEPFRIDMENIDQRIIALPGRDGSYSQLTSIKGGKLFYRFGSDLTVYDFNKRESSTFMAGVSGYSISADGKKLLYRAGRNWGIVNTSGTPRAGDGRITTTPMDVLIDPMAEWGQMLLDAWRLNRDYFYAPNMHGVDWKANYERYKEYLPDLAHRSDLNYILSEMLGELCVGHSYIRGGAFPSVDRVPGGLLGADYEIVSGRYRLKKIYSGLNWNPGLRAPLTEPGVNIAEGEYILRVNGKELRAPANIFSLFENTANKQVVLTVNTEPTETGAREVTVVPVSSENSLRNRDWIEGNRKKVEEMTGGRVGYVYLPNTGSGGYSYFNRYFFPQQDKEAFVIDERFNGGGQVANYIIDYLDRELMNYWAPREGPDYTSPFAANFGPKVMIINEYAGSGGDWMPFFFQERGIGKLVGKRTWGGLVGIGGTPGLMDGGSVTAPNFGIWSKDGEWIVENEGVAPDIEVEMTPQDVINGRDPQLERAIQVVLEELRSKRYVKPARPSYPIRK